MFRLVLCTKATSNLGHLRTTFTRGSLKKSEDPSQDLGYRVLVWRAHTQGRELTRREEKSERCWVGTKFAR